MHESLLIAWREFKYTALTKAFIFGAVIMPSVLFAAAVLVPYFTDTPPEPMVGKVVVYDPSAEMPAALAAVFGSPEVGGRTGAVRPAPWQSVQVEVETDGQRLAALRAQVGQDPHLLALVVLEAGATSVGDDGLVGALPYPSYVLYVEASLKRDHLRALQEGVSQAVLWARLLARGIEPGAMMALLAPPRGESRRVGADGSDKEDQLLLSLLLPFAFMFLLWMTTFSVGNYLMTSTVEEKSSRVMEVLLSAVSPLQLMVGKILGLSLVALVILLVYGVAGGVGLWMTGYAGFVQPAYFLYLLVFFLMAYLMIAGIMATIGSVVSDLREAQSLVAPVTLVLMLPIFAWSPIRDDPHGALAVVSSFIPPLTPFVMILRLTSAQSVPAWELAVVLVWGFACAAGLIWFCARVFRVGVLMTGKAPTPRELLRWFRDA